MKDFIATVYEFFSSIYGDNLASYLYGYCGDGDGSLYGRIAMYVIIVTVFLCAFFYFAVADSERYKLKYWFGFLFLSGILSGFIGFYLPYSDIERGMVCMEYLFSVDNVAFFGIVNSFYSVLLFFLTSMIMKFFGKKSARYTPF